MTMQTLKDCLAGARKGLLVAVQLKGPVGAQLEGVDFESHLGRIQVLGEFSSSLGFRNRAAQSGKPLLHNLSDAIAHRSRTAVKLRGHGSEKAAAAKHTAFDVAQPRGA